MVSTKDILLCHPLKILCYCLYEMSIPITHLQLIRYLV